LRFILTPIKRDHMKIVVLLRHAEVRAWTFSPENRQRFLAAYPDADIVICRDELELERALGDAEIAIVWRFNQDWFCRAPKLKWLATPAAGKEYLNVSPPVGVKMVFGSFHGELMGETVLALMLGHCRGLFATAKMDGVPWPRKELAEIMTPLRGSHVVILGFGNVGQWIARLAKPFGVRITGIRRNPSATASENNTDRHESRSAYLPGNDSILPLAALDSVLPLTDHLVLSLPGGSETDHMIDARRLALLPPRSAIYNVGRGNAIDEEALACALRERRIAAAYLDVFAQEPLTAESPLRSCPSAFLLPHISAVAPNYLDLFMEELASRLKSEW
jgi:phosphoglycerate dehydrogenase-like enzyme